MQMLDAICMPVAGQFPLYDTVGPGLIPWHRFCQFDGGAVKLPDPIGKNEALAPVLSSIHFWSAMALIALIVVHASAALWHHFSRRDGTLERML